jgi:hypothetical protein
MQVHFLDVYNSQIPSKYKSFLPFQDYMFKEISQVNHIQWCSWLGHVGCLIGLILVVELEVIIAFLFPLFVHVP